MPTSCDTDRRGQKAGSRAWTPTQPLARSSPSPNHHPPPTPKPSHPRRSSPHPHLFSQDEPPPRPPATGICKRTLVAQGITAPVAQRAGQGTEPGTAGAEPCAHPRGQPRSGRWDGDGTGVPLHSSSLAAGVQPPKFPKEAQGIDNCPKKSELFPAGTADGNSPISSNTERSLCFGPGIWGFWGFFSFLLAEHRSSHT